MSECAILKTAAVYILYIKGALMKRRMLIIIIGIVGIVALVLVGWYVMFVHFGRGPVFPFLAIKEINTENLQIQQGAQEGVIAEEELMALVETEEEAQSIAEQYGIEFVSCSDGVAMYKTEEDPAVVIARGEEKGYPPLYLNLTRTTMMTTD